MTTIKNKRIILTQIDGYIEKRDFKIALSKITKYLSKPENELFDTLLSKCIGCQIELGLFNEAIQNIALMFKKFPEFYKEHSYKLAISYASCCRPQLLEQLLAITQFSEQEYQNIAKCCYDNTNYELAEKLFNQLATSSNIGISQSSKEYLKLIALYKQRPENIFLPQTYSSFKYQGNKLLPGHVVYVCYIRDKYKENRLSNKSQKTKHPYMIWKIEEDKIYAFRVSTSLTNCSHKFSAYNYPTAQRDRYLETELVCLNEHDVVTVSDKITDYDYEQAINSMNLSTCTSQKDICMQKSEISMGDITTNIKVKEGSIIMICNPEIHYYYVCSIDNYHDQYCTYEVDNNFLPVGKKVSYVYISTNQPISAIFYPDNLKKENNNPNKRVLEKPNS